jgi:anaerobic selenocysteine-containing dehydrogenase
VNPRPGSDAALALGVARGILERGSIDTAYIQEQTDLPFLVREDTQRYLRQADLEDGGSEDIFYVYDLSSDKIAEAPGTPGRWSDSIALGKLEPALDGRYPVQTRDGTAHVRPVMTLLRERLKSYTPEYVASVTGVSPKVQAALTERLASSPRGLIYASWGSNKTYHSDLLHRSMILLSALRGWHGRPGGGVRFAAWLPFEGSNALMGTQPGWLMRQMLRFYTPPPRMMEDGIAAASPNLGWTPSHLFLYLHAGLDKIWDDDASLDPTLPRPARAYMQQALEQGWTRARPARDNPPRVLFTSGVNPLRRWPVPQLIEETLWPKLNLVVALDFRVSTTGMKADLLLPAAGYYEKRGIKYAVAIAPYVVVGDRAVQPLGEAKSEWEVMAHLAQKIQERAVERGLEGDLTRFYETFSEEGRFGPDDAEKVIDVILRGSSSTGGLGWEEMRKRGAVAARSAGGWSTTSAVGSEIEPGGTLTPSRIHVEGKHAWPTLTGRQQFYLDHPWFLEGDEALPRWKPVPPAGGDHPIQLTGGHTRWSIHAIWRANASLLKLQRGGPVMWMSVEDARERGIKDGNEVRVFNAHGSFRVATKVAPSVAPGEAILYHAWEPYQFPGWKSHMEVISSPYKPLHLVGDYGHLRYRLFEAGPVHVPRGIPVEIALA